MVGTERFSWRFSQNASEMIPLCSGCYHQDSSGPPPDGLVLVMNFSVCTFPHAKRKRRAGALLSTRHDKTLAGFLEDFNNVSKDELNSSSLCY